MSESEVLILGAGVGGLAAGWALGEQAQIIEQEDRAGGLVRSERIGEYWFDQVIHLLHLGDPVVGERLHALMGDVLAPCPPDAFVECAAGVARYPIQNNLWSLDPAVVAKCVEDFPQADSPNLDVSKLNHEELLLETFGEGLCELFFFPYQRKMWKRPLSELAPAGFQWNIARPDYQELVRGAAGPQDKGDEPEVYNGNGWYPRPKRGSALRGMEILSVALASQVPHLHLNHRVLSIDPESRSVRASLDGKEKTFGYSSTCVSTLPLPVTLDLCTTTPAPLKRAVAGLKVNRVRSIMLCVEGERPADSGLWRYFTDESIVFTRLVFMSEFDPEGAPENGFALLVEVVERSEDPIEPDASFTERVIADVRRTGWLRDDHRVIDSRVMTIDPAYVVFSPGNQAILEEAFAFLRTQNIEPLGRYGRWEYSSMASGIGDGLELGDALLAQCKPS